MRSPPSMRSSSNSRNSDGKTLAPRATDADDTSKLSGAITALQVALQMSDRRPARPFSATFPGRKRPSTIRRKERRRRSVGRRNRVRRARRVRAGRASKRPSGESATGEKRPFSSACPAGNVIITRRSAVPPVDTGAARMAPAGRSSNTHVAVTIRRRGGRACRDCRGSLPS